jgi:hypothetical protein
MPLFANKLGSSRSYRLLGRMRGHTDTIHMLAVSNNGKLLASGGKAAILNKESDIS